MVSLRRLSEKTLAKYQGIVDGGGELTPRQQKALQGHALITDEAFVEALLRPDVPPVDRGYPCNHQLAPGVTECLACKDAHTARQIAAEVRSRPADVKAPVRPEVK